jgi:ABC-type transporter Mla subunit MlaD
VTGNGELARFLVLVFLACCQTAILRRAWLVSRGDDRPRLGELGASFAADLKQRARRGEGPDWLRYQAEVDRLFEGRDDRLRSLAAAGLALGLGGTLLALLVSLRLQHLGTGQELNPLVILESTGLCLIGSLIGVVVNLTIVLALLPAAERRFAAAGDSLMRALATVAANHPPQEALAAALQDALGGLRQVLDAELADSFSKAVTGWPLIVERLGGQVETLGTVIEAQSRDVGGAVRDLEVCSRAVASSSQQLQPATAKLGEAVAQLVDLPVRLQVVVEASRDAWLASFRQQQGEAVRELVSLQHVAEESSQARERVMLAAVRELQAAVAEVQAAVGQIPGQLGVEVAAAAGRLGREFGSEARAHTLDLADHLERQHEQMILRVAQHEQEWRNNIGSVVEELLGQVASRIDRGVVAQLQAAGVELQKVAANLPEAATRIEAALCGLSAAQQEAVSGWDEVSQRTRAAADRLAEADGQLGVGVAALKESAEHLERIARLDGDFEANLRTIVADVAAHHLAGVEPFHQELMEMARELRLQRGQLEDVLERQSDFVRRCIEVLMKGRGLATLERSV